MTAALVSHSAFPAKAGINPATASEAAKWIPAFAGNAIFFGAR
ncbi:MAG: hypothetical protein ACM3JG_02415 [Thiohalocapsa sp.]